MTNQNNKHSLQYKNPGEFADYTFKSSTIFRINGNILYQGENENEFRLNLIETGTNNKFEIISSNTKSSSGFDFFGEFNALIKDMVEIKNHVLLTTDTKGQLLDLLNKEEWNNKWNGLKKQMEFYKSFKDLTTEQKEEIIKNGDKEYSPEYSNIADLEKSSFYRFLFAPIYDTKYTINDKIVLKEETEPSGILKSFQLPCQSYIELDSYDPESKEGTLIKRHNLDLSLLDEAAVKMLFKQDYPFVSEEYKRYTYDQFTAYVIDFSSGFIKSIKNSSYEAINSVIEIESENEILMSNL